MKILSKVIVFLLVSLFAFSFLFGQKLKSRDAKVPSDKETYIYIDENTPDYLVKKAIKKKVGIAFHLKGSSAEWIAGKIPLFKNSSPIIFVKGNLSKLEKGYLDQLAKITEFRIKIYCFGDNCQKNKTWKHPLIKNNGIIFHEKIKKKDFIVFDRKGKKEQAEQASITDSRDFLKDPVVNGCLYFKKHKMAFLSLDSKVNSDFYKNAEFLVVYSSHEKKLSDFIEKNF